MLSIVRLPAPARTRGFVARTVATALVALSACGGSTEPSLPFGGDYALRTSNGAALPAPLVPDGAPIIRSGVLSVMSGDSLRVTLRIGSTAAEAGDQRLFFRYQQSGDSLIIPIPFGAGGKVQGRTVRLHVGLPLPPSQGFALIWHDLTFER